MSNLPQAPGDAFADPTDDQQAPLMDETGFMYMDDDRNHGDGAEDIFYSDLESCVVRLRGLPFYVTEDEVRAFVAGYPVEDPEGVIIIPFGAGRGDGYIRFVSTEVAALACNQLQRKMIGTRYIELQPSSDAMMATIRGQVSQRNAMLSSNRVLRLRGLPFRAVVDDVHAFFEEAASEIVDVAFVETSDGRQTGDAYVELASDAGAEKCMNRNRQLMGTRYIEVIDSTAVEREVALTTHRYRSGNHNRMGVGSAARDAARFAQQAMLPSVSVGTTAPAAFTPFDMMGGGWGMPAMMNPFAAMAFQTMLLQQQQQFLLLQQQQAQQLQQQQQKAAAQAQRRAARQQQQAGGQQPQRFVVRIRGLPFSANEAMIAEFFNDVRIPRQGVHMVLNLQDRPTGEAFVEVMSEDDVQQALAHNGGALGHRYIEVFRSSIADMNRLGGEPASAAASSPVDLMSAMMPSIGMGLPSSAPYFPMLPMMQQPLGMPTASVGHHPGLMLGGSAQIKVEVKPNEEYLRKYNEEMAARREAEEAAAAAAGAGESSASHAPDPNGPDADVANEQTRDAPAAEEAASTEAASLEPSAPPESSPSADA